MESCLYLQGYRLLLFTTKQEEITISAVDQLTNETFSVNSFKLVKVNASTIEVALKKQVPYIKCGIKRNEKQLIFAIIVDLEYLPKIEETIILQLVEGDKEQKLVILNELKADVQNMQKRLQFETNHNRIKIGSLDCSYVKNNDYKCQLNEGHYLLEISGVAMNDFNQNYYDDECEQDQNYDQNYNGHLKFSRTLTVTLQVIQSNKTQQFIFGKGINKGDGHETLFAFTKFFQLKRKGLISINLNSVELNVTISNSFVVIRPALKI